MFTIKYFSMVIFSALSNFVCAMNSFGSFQVSLSTHKKCNQIIYITIIIIIRLSFLNSIILIFSYFVCLYAYRLFVT